MPSTTSETCQAQLNEYLSEIQDAGFCLDDEYSLNFWKQRLAVYYKLAPLAQDVIAAAASQAYVERIFSVCVLLAEGRRKRMSQSLEMRVSRDASFS